MKKIALGITSLALAGIISGCSQTTEAQMERTITINSNVQLESSLDDSNLQVDHLSIQLPEGLSTENSYAGFLGKQFYFNTEDGIYEFDVDAESYEKVTEGSFYEISKNGKRALTSINGVTYVVDFETMKKVKIAPAEIKEMVSFANDEGTEVFHIYDGSNEDTIFELIHVETQEKQSWSTTDQLSQNNLLLAAKKAENGIYVTGENKDGEYGLYQILDGNAVEKIAWVGQGLLVESFDFLSPTTIIFSGMVDNQTGIYLKDLTTNKETLLVAGGQDEEGIWTPSYKLSPDKTKILFDTPVQVGEEYKTNVYAAEIKGGTLSNATRLIENGDLFAIISVAGAWSEDSKTAYVHTYHTDSFTFDTVEKFIIK